MRGPKFTAFCVALFWGLLLTPYVAAQEQLSVQVKEGELRATPSFLGKIVARLAYGDRVHVLEDRGAWKKVSPGSGRLQGWMHASALTSKRIVLKAGQANVQTSASQHELALAGKGFSEDVEAAFRKQNKNLDYTWINRMETFKVSPEQMRAFLVQGGVVTPGEGGRP